MNSVQEHLLELLEEIDKICHQHGIRYYLAGGCLVGALRNKGFLPWDDDADIHMTREDAFRLRELFRKGRLPKNRVILSYLDYNDAPVLHWRYVDTSTAAITRSALVTNTPLGQFVDIFILNPAPKSECEQEKYREDFNLYWELSQHFVTSSLRSDSLLRRYKFWERVKKIVGKRAVYRYFQNKLFRLKEDSSSKYAVLSPLPPAMFLDKAIFGVPRKVSFENTKLCVPHKAELMLSECYGSNWIFVPRLVDRDTHTFIVDMDFSYKEYLKTINIFLDRKKALKLSRQWKKNWFYRLPERNYVNPRTHAMKLQLKALEIEKHIKDLNINLDNLLINRDYQRILTIFSEYLSIQRGSNASYWKLYLPLSDETAFYVWKSAFMLGDYSWVKTIIERREKVLSKRLSKDIIELRELCDAADQLMFAIWTLRDCNKADELLSAYLNDSASVLFFRGKLATDIMLRGSKDESVFNNCCHALRLFPQDGEVMFWTAECLKGRGRMEDAKKYYIAAEKTLTNGILLTRVREILCEFYGESDND